MTFLLVGSNNKVLRYDGTTGLFIDEFVPPLSGGLGVPLGITIGSDDNLYVSNGLLREVLRYDGMTGAFLDIFASEGGLSFAHGLTFGPDGNLYVSAFGRDRVLRYNGTTGSFIDAFVSIGSGGLDAPNGLTFGPDGNLYVVSEETDEVLRYNGTTGAFLDSFASNGRLDTPSGLTFGPDGNLYVSSLETDEVIRYDGTNGSFLDSFVSAGSGGLDGPEYLIFGPDGNLYVSSSLTNEVLRYDGTTGAFLGVFASEELENPFGLVFAGTPPNTAQEQIIAPESLSVAVIPGNPVSFDINYSTNPIDTPTTGLGLRVHWDSTQVSFTNFTNTLSAGEQPVGEPQLDTNDLDNDPNTDFFIVKAWNDAEETWPAAMPAFPERLFSANFLSNANFAGTTVNFTAASTAEGATFLSTSVELTASGLSLDIDGNGETDALTDGILAVRYLFGLGGDPLIGEVVGDGATRTSADAITNYLDIISDPVLDIDGNGMADALTDGILLVRYLFGLTGEPLVSGVVASDATRDTADEIEAHLRSFDLLAASRTDFMGVDASSDMGILSPY